MQIWAKLSELQTQWCISFQKTNPKLYKASRLQMNIGQSLQKTNGNLCKASGFKGELGKIQDSSVNCANFSKSSLNLSRFRMQLNIEH
jgi:hypothetical protein